MDNDDRKLLSPHMKRLIKNDDYNSDDENWQKYKNRLTVYDRPVITRCLTSPAILSRP